MWKCDRGVLLDLGPAQVSLERSSCWPGCKAPEREERGSELTFVQRTTDLKALRRAPAKSDAESSWWATRTMVGGTRQSPRTFDPDSRCPPAPTAGIRDWAWRRSSRFPLLFSVAKDLDRRNLKVVSSRFFCIFSQDNRQENVRGSAESESSWADAELENRSEEDQTMVPSSSFPKQAIPNQTEGASSSSQSGWRRQQPAAGVASRFHAPATIVLAKTGSRGTH